MTMTRILGKVEIFEELLGEWVAVRSYTRTDRRDLERVLRSGYLEVLEVLEKHYEDSSAESAEFPKIRWRLYSLKK